MARNTTLTVITLALISALSVAFFSFYYLAAFHSDGAAIQVLARSSAGENSLLPRNFNYGNQLILFRANLPIALFLKMGWTGYGAFTAGSSLNILFYLSLSVLAINSVIGRWPLALGLGIAALFPIGVEDADYLIGQQSHLANVCFAIIIVTQIYRLLGNAGRWPILFAALPVFCMASESPARAVLILVPLLLVVASTLRIGRTILAGVVLGVPLVAGYFVNAYLVELRHVVGLTELVPATATEIVANVRTLLAMIWSDYFGSGEFQVTNDAPFYLPFTGLKILFILGALLFLMQLCATLRQSLQTVPFSLPQAAGFFFLVGFCGLVVGMSATALLIKTPDIRHFLWSLEICKLGFYMIGWHLLERRLNGKTAAAVLCLTVVGLSTPVASFLYAPNRALLKQLAEQQYASPPRQAFTDQMARLGVHTVFGNDFWQMLRLEVLFPPAEAGVLGAWEGKIYYANWLTRPSLRCASGTVLYLLGRGEVDQKIVTLVQQNGGVALLQTGDETLYAAPPVWEQTGCPT